MAEPDAVTMAYCHGDEVAHSWHAAVTDLIGFDMTTNQRIIRGGFLAMKCGTMGLVEGRNQAVERFLTEVRGTDWLWWIDTDMGFAPDAVEKLISVADPVERPIVGGLAFAQLETDPDGLGGYVCRPRPTMFDWVKKPDGTTGFAGRARYPGNALVQVAGTGSACLLIHRSVFVAIAEQYGPTWYDRITNPTDDQVQGEDLSFCIRASAVGFPIYVHTGVRTNHLKHVWLQEADFWAQVPPEPATDAVDVIVPTMGRPASAGPFMESLRASTGLATVYAVIDVQRDEDNAIAWNDAGAVVIDSTDYGQTLSSGDPAAISTFARKFNLAYRETSTGDGLRGLRGVGPAGQNPAPAPWVFLVGDDCRFTPGWLDHAQAAAEGDRFHIIGTQDGAGGNDRVRAGEHATHFLIRRSYVDEVGACWDGPGVVCHEGYNHWFNDDEIVLAAKRRGVFTPAMGSVVDHLHPYFGKGRMDATYEFGESRRDEDQKLFQQREAANR